MPAVLSRAVETSTSTGTGNFTLDGAATTLYGTNAKTFSNALSGSTFGFYYDIFHQTLAEFERGVGYLSGGALVRALVIESSNANTLVNFSAGDKVVMSASTPDELAFEPQNANQINSFRRSMFSPFNTGTFAPNGSTVYFTPYFNTKEMIVTSVGVSVTTAGTAGHVARLGIFDLSARNTFRLIYDFGTVPVDFTGDKIITTSFKLPVGCYYTAITSQSGTFRASQPAIYNNWSNGDTMAANSGCHVTTTLVATTPFSATHSVNSSSLIVNAATPNLYFRTSTGLYQ